MFCYHYTTGVNLKRIVAAGQLPLSVAQTANGEGAACWFSTCSQWPTFRNRQLLVNGTVHRLTLWETGVLGHGLFRIVVPLAAAPLTFEQFLASDRVTPEYRALMERDWVTGAHRATYWRVSLRPVSRDRWLRCELFDVRLEGGHRWRTVEDAFGVDLDTFVSLMPSDPVPLLLDVPTPTDDPVPVWVSELLAPWGLERYQTLDVLVCGSDRLAHVVAPFARRRERVPELAASLRGVSAAAFDLIVGGDAREDTVRAAVRALRPGGTLILAVEEAVSGTAPWGVARGDSGQCRFTPSYVERSARLAGCSSVEIWRGYLQSDVIGLVVRAGREAHG